MSTYAGRAVLPALISDNRGNALPGINVTVYNRGTVVKPALYTDRTKATTLANPFLTDAYGNVFPYVEPGEYDMLVNGVTIPFSVVNDPAEPVDSEVADLAITTAKLAANAVTAAKVAADVATTAALNAGLAGKEDSIPPGTYVEVFDARKYHASGSIGVSAVDDTNAIQAAADAAMAAGAGEVLVSAPGTWLGKRQTTADGLTPGTGGAEWCVNIPTPSNITVRIAQGATFKLADGELSGTKVCNLIRMGAGSSSVTFANAHIVGPGTLDGNRANNPTTGDINWGALALIWGRGRDCSVGHDGLQLINSTADAACAFGIINTGGAGNSGGLWDTHRGQRYDFSGAHIENCAEGIITIDVDWVAFHHLSFKDMVSQDVIEPINGRHVSIYEIDAEGSPQGIDVFSGVSDFEIYAIRMKDCYGIQVGAGGSRPVSNGRIHHVHGESNATALVWIMASGGGGTSDITVHDITGKDMDTVVLVENQSGQPMSNIVIRPVNKLAPTPSAVRVIGSDATKTAIARAAVTIDSNESLSIDPATPPTAQTNFATVTTEAASAYGQYLASTGAINASVTWTAACEAGTYLFRLIHRVDVNAGIYNLYVDGVLKGTVDGYSAAGVAYGVISHIPDIVMTKGRHTIELRMATKNAASADYSAALEDLSFWKVA